MKEHYNIFQNVHLYLPLKFKSAGNNVNDIAVGRITVNNFFTHWIKEIYIKRYGDDIPFCLLTNPVDIY